MENWFSFTPTELEIALLLAQGLSNKEIALRRQITVSTVEFHLKHIFVKLKVKSRAEAIIKLRDSTAAPEPSPREPPAAPGGGNGGDGDHSIPPPPVGPPPGQPETGQPPPRPPEDLPDRAGGWRRRWFFPIYAGLVLAILLILWLSRPDWWLFYAREAETSDGSTVGQIIERANASNGKVHGQFGVTGEPPWPGKSGQVIYRGIFIPLPVEVYLNLGYSKFSTPTVPIQVFLDDEIVPRQKLDTVDQHSWETFDETGPVSLGKITPGIHSIRFFTEGQTYGTADLDWFKLSIKLRDHP